MKKNFYNPLISLGILIILVFCLSKGISNIPPLGNLLNPYSGVVQNEKDSKLSGEVKLNGCLAPIDVFYDERNVPHVFAQNDHDMYLAQGYITAKDRLWQMDFISYTSAGRLSEILGKDYLKYDRLQRRIGILSSAESTLKLVEKNPETKLALDAFTSGVNAYIAELDSKTAPFEYKLLDYNPEKWTNLKSVLIMKYISAMLAGYEEDISMTHMYAALGRKEFQKLFPEHQSLDGDSLNPKMDAEPYADYIDQGFLNNKVAVAASSYNPRLGSNNWAVNGTKSKTGNPILCNDPHLGLMLPSIWYEIQLSSKTTNVYGVSIPGTLGVIIGFNDKIAWGVTNGATDDKDWYKLQVKDDYITYKMDDEWLKTQKRIENIKIKGQKTFVDTVYSTIHGPIVFDDRFEQDPDAKNLALKWSLHEPTNEFLTFLHLNKAKNYDDFKESVSHYQCPVQNFVYASSDNTIAIHHQGLLYEKWNGQGRFVMDGSKKSHLYKKSIPSSDLPQLLNPENGYVFSANNFPEYAAPPSYMNGNYSEVRAYHIQKKLDEKKKFSIDDMKKMQFDNENAVAAIILPELLLTLNNDIGKDAKAQKTIQILNQWNYQFDQNSIAANFFDKWWKELELLTWDELKSRDYFLRYPDPSVLIKLIKTEKESVYFDRKDTKKTETFQDISRQAFSNVLKSFENKTWGNINNVKITHLSQIEALSVFNMHLGGHPDAINATSENWGPSWRMIVELGDKPKAYGIYSGGQSGNPGNKNSQEFIKPWSEGKYYTLNYYSNYGEAKRATKKQLVIKK